MKTILFVLLLACLLCGVVSCFAETAEPAMEIPAEYKTAVPEGGTVTRIEYPSRDYARDSAEITKPAALYLPPNYSEEEHYDVLVLCHGIGGTDVRGVEVPNHARRLVMIGDAARHIK